MTLFFLNYRHKIFYSLTDLTQKHEPDFEYWYKKDYYLLKSYLCKLNNKHISNEST